MNKQSNLRILRGGVLILLLLAAFAAALCGAAWGMAAEPTDNPAPTKTYDRNDNIALNKPVTTSTSIELSGGSGATAWYYGAKGLTDKKLSEGIWITETRIHSEQSTTANSAEWAAIDLEKAYMLECVKLYLPLPLEDYNNNDNKQHSMLAEDYEIQVSMDGTNWTTVYTKTGDVADDLWLDGGTFWPSTDDTKVPGNDNLTVKELLEQTARTCEFTPVRGRYVRFYATKLSPYTRPQDNAWWYHCALSEMEVYADQNAARDSLQELYDENKDTITSDYTVETAATFTQALEEAETVLQDPNATQDEYNSAYAKLNSAIEGLTPKTANTQALQALIAECKALDESDYSKATWSRLAAALAKAEELPANALQSQVDSEFAALTAAKEGLREVIPGADYDRSENLALNRPVSASSDFTGSSWYSKSHITNGNRVGGMWLSDVNRHTTQNASEQHGNEWVTVDLEKLYTIDCIKLYPPACLAAGNFSDNQPHVLFAEAYKVQISVDGENWITVYSTDSDTDVELWSGETWPETEEEIPEGFDKTAVELIEDHARICVFTPARARYVRFYADTLAPSPRLHVGTNFYHCALSEIEVYGNPLTNAKDNLLEKCAIYENYAESDYTSESWTEFAAKLATAKAEAEKTDATIESLQATATALDAAAQALASVPADLSELNKLIAECEALNESDYSGASWKVLQEKLTAAKALTTESLQSNVNKAKAELEAAKNALVVPVDLTALTALIAECEKLDSRNYISTSWAAFIEKLNAAKAITTASTQEEADAAKTALEAAKIALMPLADRTELNECIEVCESLNAMHYTSESWATLIEKLNAAKEIGELNTQEEVDAALAALNAAKDGLRERPSSGGDGSGDKTDGGKKKCGGSLAGSSMISVLILAAAAVCLIRRKKHTA